MKESTIESRLVKGAKDAGWIAFKFISPGNVGVPDRLLISPNGRIIFVELKTDTGKLTPLQKLQIIRLEKYGQDVRVFYGLKDVNAFLAEIREEVVHSDIQPARVSETRDRHDHVETCCGTVPRNGLGLRQDSDRADCGAAADL